jgi:O-antigen/teichoic acid export membrane protein
MTPPAAALPARIAAHPLAALGATSASNAGIAAFTLLNGILIARLLGPEGRGSLFAMVAFPAAAAALVGSFAHNAIARRAAGGLSAGARLNGLVLYATLLLAAATALASVALVALGGAQLDAGDQRAALLYAAASAPAAVGLRNFQAVDMGAGHWSRYNLLRLLPYPVILAGAAACMATGIRDPRVVLAIVLLSTVAPFAVRMGLAFRDGGFERVRAAELRALHRESLPFAAAGAGAAALAHVDQLVAAAALAPAAAGVYAVAQRAGLLLAPLASAAGVVAFSHAARGGDGGRPPGARAYPLVLAAAALALVPGVWLLVPVLYGAAFAPARLPAVIALAAGLAAALAELREQRVEGGGDPLRVVPGRVAGALALAAGAVAFGLRWGAAGIAGACVLGQVVRGLVSLSLARRRT